MQTQITVKYNNPPAQGKKLGNLRDAQGNTYFGYPNVIGNVQPGQTVTIEYQTKNWNGREAKVVDRVLSSSGGGGGGVRDRATQRSIVAQSIIKALGPEFDEAQADVMWEWHARRVHHNPNEDTPPPQQQMDGAYDGNQNQGNDLDDEIPF